MLSIHLLSYVLLSNHDQSINQSINQFILISQNITGAYIIMLACRRLLTMRLPGKAAV